MNRIVCLLIRLFKNVGMEKLAWSLRRLYVPVSSHALVLDIGSGGNPYPRANVLLDAHEGNIERSNVPLIKDRPMVFGLAESLPFKDRSFDFVIASHVLEHSRDPEAFLHELMRVSKRGYIETPDAFFERINPYICHRLEITYDDSKISIFKKASWRHDNNVVDLYEKLLKGVKFLKFMRKNPELFMRGYFWHDIIDFEILNPKVDINWPIPEHLCSEPFSYLSTRVKLHNFLIKIIRLLFSQSRRNKNIDISKLLICPTGKSESLSFEPRAITCNECKSRYPVSDGIPVLISPKMNHRIMTELFCG